VSQPSEIEKKSLEAHVELCAERYKYLYDQIKDVNTKVDDLHTVVVNMDSKLDGVVSKRNDQLLAWGVGIIGFLLATVAWLIKNYMIN
jgi:hypothetical protein